MTPTFRILRSALLKALRVMRPPIATFGSQQALTHGTYHVNLAAINPPTFLRNNLSVETLLPASARFVLKCGVTSGGRRRWTSLLRLDVAFLSEVSGDDKLSFIFFIDQILS
jgi:hypothetical protein